MTPAEFKRKWARYSGKETSAYQEHFNDLCALLEEPTPATADPTGNESFCFQKRVVKDAELFALEEPGRVAEQPETDRERGFADVWKRGCFAWEYKGKKKNLDAAYQQLLRYRESLLNPPLLVVCDFDRYIVRTNFNGTVQETHEFRNANIDDPGIFRLLRAAFTDPDFLKPQRTTDEVTEKLAQQIGEVARSLQQRESVELIDARSRRELAVAQRKNLRIARFLNRIVFCFFAEDTGLLPRNVVTEIFKTGDLRENWLNPPEWVTTRILEFPGSTDGPWSRFVTDPNARGIGTVRYARIEARDKECANKLAKRTLTNLYNERPAWLAHAHAKLDEAVATSYGFDADLKDEQILEKLLALNIERVNHERKSASKQASKKTSRLKSEHEMI